MWTGACPFYLTLVISFLSGIGFFVSNPLGWSPGPIWQATSERNFLANRPCPPAPHRLARSACTAELGLRRGEALKTVGLGL